MHQNHGKKKYKVVTLGCRTNQYESAAYIEQLKQSGFREAAPGEVADLCVVNTCTVTASADRRSLEQIRRVHREHSPKTLVVTGCFAEKNAKQLQALPMQIERVPNARKEKLLPAIFPDEQWSEFAIRHFEAHTRAFVKIQDGCNSYCSYCVIPFVRGRSRSRPVDEIVREVEGLIEEGYREVVLTGINIGDFDGGSTPPISLANLVRRLDQLPGLARLRLSSIDPDEVDEELLEAIIHGKTTCHSMHIVLQSGSNVVLKRMRRKYTRTIFLETVDRLRKKSDRFTFTTDVIVGFPGETEGDFAETLALVREIQFAKVHVFPYSDREKTRASRMAEKVSPLVMKQRKKQLMELAEQMAFLGRKRYIGAELEVLVENSTLNQEGTFFGHSEQFFPVYLRKKRGSQASVRPHEIVRVQCDANHAQGLQGWVGT